MAETFTNKLTATITTGLVLIVALLVWSWISHARIEQASNVVLQFIDGRKINLYELRTRPILVTFWATTCETCIKKTLELKILYQRLKPRGLELIAVAMAYDPPNRILAFSEDNEIPYPIALDIDASVAKAFNKVTLTPTTFLISPDMKIVLTAIGDLDIKEVEEKISIMLLKQNPLTIMKTS